MLGIALTPWLEYWGVIQILAWTTEGCSASLYPSFGVFQLGLLLARPRAIL